MTSARAPIARREVRARAETPRRRPYDTVAFAFASHANLERRLLASRRSGSARIRAQPPGSGETIESAPTGSAARFIGDLRPGPVSNPRPDGWRVPRPRLERGRRRPARCPPSAQTCWARGGRVAPSRRRRCARASARARASRRSRALPRSPLRGSRPGAPRRRRRPRRRPPPTPSDSPTPNAASASAAPRAAPSASPSAPGSRTRTRGGTSPRPALAREAGGGGDGGPRRGRPRRSARRATATPPPRSTPPSAAPTADERATIPTRDPSAGNETARCPRAKAGRRASSTSTAREAETAAPRRRRGPEAERGTETPPPEAAAAAAAAAAASAAEGVGKLRKVPAPRTTRRTTTRSTTRPSTGERIRGVRPRRPIGATVGGGFLVRRRGVRGLRRRLRGLPRGLPRVHVPVRAAARRWRRWGEDRARSRRFSRRRRRVSTSRGARDLEVGVAGPALAQGGAAGVGEAVAPGRPRLERGKGGGGGAVQEVLRRVRRPGGEAVTSRGARSDPGEHSRSGASERVGTTGRRFESELIVVTTRWSPPGLVARLTSSCSTGSASSPACRTSATRG